MSEYLNLLGGDYVQISGAMIRRFGIVPGAVYSKLAFYYRGFLTNPITMDSMPEFDGKKYFFKDLEEIGLELRLSKFKVSEAIKELERAGLVLVQRKKQANKQGKPRNYYFLTDRIEQVMKEDHELQIAEALQAYRIKEEKAGTPAADIELELEKLEEMLRGGAMSNQSAFYKTRKKTFKIKIQKPEAAAEAEAAAQAIEDMLPTGMLSPAPAEPAPVSFANEPLPTIVKPAPIPEREPAANKRAARKAEEKTKLSLKEIWAKPGLNRIYDHIDLTQNWTADLIAETCNFLYEKIDYTLISKMDVDAGFLDYTEQVESGALVSKPARYVAKCIVTRTESRIAAQGVKYDPTKRRLEKGEFISKLKEKFPDHPMVKEYEKDQAAWDEGILIQA